jgi:DNA-binding GntR family transcriptional regulator
MQAIRVACAEFLPWRDPLPMPHNVAENVSDHERITALLADGKDDPATAAMAKHREGTLDVFLPMNIIDPSPERSAASA